jgi:hypothetical protein
MQCIFYLGRFGTPQAMISFWVRHRLIEDACRFVFAQQLPHSLFLEEVCMHRCVCLLHTMKLSVADDIDCWLLSVAQPVQEPARCSGQGRSDIRELDAVLACFVYIPFQEASVQATDRLASLYV